MARATVTVTATGRLDVQAAAQGRLDVHVFVPELETRTYGQETYGSGFYGLRKVES